MRGNVLPLQPLILVIRRLKKQGKRIAFTNGCFDLLHIGHLSCLERIKAQADILVVAVNTDASVRRLKGRGRPLVPARERARLVAALKPVDWVILFSELTPIKLIRALRPDLLAKGGDWTPERIVGREVVESYGGRVLEIPTVAGRSTTRLVEQMGKAVHPTGSP